VLLAALIAFATIFEAAVPGPAPQNSPAQQLPPTAPSAAPAPQQNPPVLVPAGTVVLDPGHGGADAGARGSTGILEKDVVISLAQLLRAALERQGLRVVLTRQTHEAPSYDDRAATANAYRGALVITLHASSTGAPGTARAYYCAVIPAAPEPAMATAAKLEEKQEAQQVHLNASRRLAESVQAQIKQKLDKSEAAPASAALRDLRSVNAPAIAVELASVSVKERKDLDPYLAPLAEAIAKGVTNFRSVAAARGREAR
jgi:N-acetylmuramoyl-L-alanine amidase